MDVDSATTYLLFYYTEVLVMVIQHNIPAMNSYRNLNNNQNAIAGNLEKLSSGYQINRAGDNAAGLAISEKMRSQITGLDAAQRNVDDGISLVKTAEGALQEVHDMLNRMTELATQSANGTYDNEVDRAALQKEVDALLSEVDRIADSTNFNGINLLDGSLDDNMMGAAGSFTVGTVTNHAGAGIGVTALAAGDFIETTYDDTALLGLLSTETSSPDDLVFGYTDANGALQTVTLALSDTGSLGTDTDALTQNVAKINAQLQANGDKFQASIDDDGNLVILSQAKDCTPGQIFNVDTAGTIAAGDYGYATGSSVEVTKEAGQMIDVTTLSALKSGDCITMNGVTVVFTDQSIDEMESGNDSIQYVSLYADGDRDKLKDKLTAEELAQSIADAFIAAKDASDGKGEIANMWDVEVRGSSITFLNSKATDNYEGDGEALQLQIGDTSDEFNQLKVSVDDMHTKALGIDGIDISNQDGATAAIDIIKDAINAVSTTRGTLGAVQNRLEHTNNNLAVQEENIQDAESTIRDTDVAAEMMEYTKNNILIQSAQSMLAQANQLPQGVLQLLG